MAALYPCWWVHACPLADSCSKQAWSRTKSCASWKSEEDCRAQLMKHLRSSSLRSGDDQLSFNALVEMAEVTHEMVEYHGPGSKKQKLSSAEDQASPLPPPADDDRIAQVAAKAALQAAMSMAQSQTSSQTSSSASASAPSLAISPIGYPANRPFRPNEVPTIGLDADSYIERTKALVAVGRSR